MKNISNELWVMLSSEGERVGGEGSVRSYLAYFNGSAPRPWSTTIISFSGDNYNLPVVLGLICSSHVGVWLEVCPLGGTESSAPTGADDGVEPKGQTVAFLLPGSRCLACCARTLSPLNSKI